MFIFALTNICTIFYRIFRLNLIYRQLLLVLPREFLIKGRDIFEKCYASSNTECSRSIFHLCTVSIHLQMDKASQTYSVSLIIIDIFSLCIFVQGGCSGRAGLHLRGGLREQPDPDLQPGRNLPARLRALGPERRRVQGTGGHCRQRQGQHPRGRQGEPPDTDILDYSLQHIY